MTGDVEEMMKDVVLCCNCVLIVFYETEILRTRSKKLVECVNGDVEVKRQGDWFFQCDGFYRCDGCNVESVGIVAVRNLFSSKPANSCHHVDIDLKLSAIVCSGSINQSKLLSWRCLPLSYLLALHSSNRLLGFDRAGVSNRHITSNRCGTEL